MLEPNQIVNQESLTPDKIVEELDRYIISQAAAKRAVAIALRNRWRRLQVSDELRKEIKPKNILFIGPTGSGKTEIARRLASFVEAPFIKVEATKFTEVGYVGRDVESIIRDLVETAIKKAREQEKIKVKSRASDAAVERILDAMLPKATVAATGIPSLASQLSSVPEENTVTREIFRKKILEGSLDDKQIEIDINVPGGGVEIMTPPGMEEMTSQLQSMFSNLTGKRLTKKKLRVKEAMRLLLEDEAAALINEEEIRKKALETVEQNGIVFIDEIDKITERTHSHVGGPSREGVQRDLLPLVEGCTVSTKYGMIKTDHILFIASGAFHLSKPSDLIPELQGRFPIRVELSALTADDFVRILTEPRASLTEQYIALLRVESVDLTFTDDGLRRVAEIAFQVNERTENIGARRLHTILERLLEDVSFNAHKLKAKSKKISIDASYVNKRLKHLADDEDLSRSIL